MKRISLFLILISLLQMSFITKDSTKLISRAWVMSRLEMGKQVYAEDIVERQRSNGIKTVLDFKSNGVCYIKVITPKGGTTKKNTWKIIEEKNQLVMYPEDKSQTQAFDIVKLSSKVLVISLEEDGIISTFYYKVYKD